MSEQGQVRERGQSEEAPTHRSSCSAYALPVLFTIRCCERSSVSVSGARELGQETHLANRPS